MTNVKRGWFLVVLTITCIGLVGCPGGAGGKLCIITGKVLQGGQPAGGESGESGLTVEFIPIDDQGNVRSGTPPYGVMVQEDGSFVADGLDGKGIPAGKYRVAVQRTDVMDEAAAVAWEAELDFTADQEITIDLDKAP